MFQGKVVNQMAKVSELLHPLDEVEQKVLRGLVRKIQRGGTEENKTALCCWFADVMHRDHKDELSTVLSMLVNKLVQEPFAGDRDLLKNILETIMMSVHDVEQAS